VDDIQMHPERYIHFSVFGAKTKGVPLSPAEEQKLRLMLDSTVTN
jgi:phospholipid/cholesterol/gamma-HCH transport system substrate-binding protein